MANAPKGAGSIINAGYGMMEVFHIVEVRCGSQEVDGIWRDVWVPDGRFNNAEFANQHAESLRKRQFTVRLRPVLG